MAIPFQISGAQTVIPGVYSTFLVSNSLPAPVPAGRSILIFGEAEEGAPGSALDIRLSFYTDFQSVRDYYKSGPLVDAARMIFSNQPSPVFGGAVQRLYIYKTNATVRAAKLVTSPANFGSIVAARFGEAGNTIKSQITTGQAESKPTKTFLYLPDPTARTFKTAVNGTVTGALAVAGAGVASDFVTALSGVTGLSTTGGTARTVITSGPMTLNGGVSGDTLTLTRASGTATFNTASVAVDDACWIAAGSTAAGGADENAGSYLVTAVTTTTLTLRQLKTNDTNATALATLTGAVVATGDLKINAPVTALITATTAAGEGAALELLDTAAANTALASLYRDSDFADMFSAATAAVATLSATIPAAGQLTVAVSGGSFATTPKVGDLVRIGRASLLAGATLKNVGNLVVTAANAQSFTAAHLFGGLTTEAISAVLLNGSTSAAQTASTFVSNGYAARRIDSSAERAVSLAASNAAGTTMPTTLIGGTNALEVGYWQSGTTAATLSIDANRVLTITPTGAGSTLSIRTGKYKTLQDLADYLNAQTGVFARVPDNRFKSMSPANLDMVNAIGILDGQALPAYNGRIKKDYYDWKQYFVNNFSLLAFSEGTLVLKSGLPDAEATTGFLSGAELGATSAADCQNALDQGLKVDVRLVVPLFSRDAQYDIADGNTDPNSSYTIDSINAATKAHAATASSTLFRKERYGYCSFDGSFNDSLQKVGLLAYERTKMFFQRHLATNGNGDSVEFLPWMAGCAVAAGRVQATLGTSMLRKPFLLNSADHYGNVSLYTTNITPDFSPDDRGQLETAIAAGLVVLRAVTGFGIRMESPDLTSRSRDNDPQAWVYERENVLFTCDEVMDTMRRVLENFIGNRTSDTSEAVIKSALEAVIRTFVGAGALLQGSVTKVKSLGNQYVAEVRVTPVEALEAITLNVIAERSVA